MSGRLELALLTSPASLPCSFHATLRPRRAPVCSLSGRPARLPRPCAASGTFLQPPLGGPQASTTCRAPRRGADRISSSPGCAGPSSSWTLYSDPDLSVTASSIAGWHGVRLSAGFLVDYYLLAASDGVRPPLEPSAALPHTAAPLIPNLDSHFLTISVRSFMPAQRQPRPLRRSSKLWAGLGRARGASSALAAAAAAPRARNRAGSAARARLRRPRRDRV